MKQNKLIYIIGGTGIFLGLELASIFKVSFLERIFRVSASPPTPSEVI